MSSLEVFLLPLLVEYPFLGGANDGPAGVASRAVSHQMPSFFGFRTGCPNAVPSIWYALVYSFPVLLVQAVRSR